MPENDSTGIAETVEAILHERYAFVIRKLVEAGGSTSDLVKFVNDPVMLSHILNRTQQTTHDPDILFTCRNRYELHRVPAMKSPDDYINDRPRPAGDKAGRCFATLRETEQLLRDAYDSTMVAFGGYDTVLVLGTDVRVCGTGDHALTLTVSSDSHPDVWDCELIQYDYEHHKVLVPLVRRDYLGPEISTVDDGKGYSIFSALSDLRCLYSNKESQGVRVGLIPQ